MISLPSPELLRMLLEYDPSTGKITFRMRGRVQFKTDAAFASWNKRFAEREAFTSSEGKGYLVGRVQYHHLKAHRVAFALAYERWPVGEIDHINGDRADNRLINLREVSTAEQARNRSITRRNKSGCIGVFWCAKDRCWVATLGRKRLGSFQTFEAASAVRTKAQADDGYHPNHGRPLRRWL